MNALKKFVLSLDLLSPSFEVRYRNKTKYKSVIGSTCTFILAAIITILTVFLGRDMFLRSNPITRINKVASPENKILLKDTVLPIYLLVNQKPDPLGFRQEFDVVTRLSHVDMNSETIVKSYFLTLGPCKEEDFLPFPKIRSDMGLSFPAASCIDTETVTDEEGNKVDSEVAINGNMGGNGSRFIEILVMRKQGKSEDLTNNYTISAGIPNIFVDNSNYENPKVIEGMAFDGQIDSSLRKQILVTMIKNTISSDTGLLFASVEKEDFITFHSKSIAYSLIKPGEPIYATVVFTSLDYHSVYEREYTKIPAVIAEVAGISKVLLWLFKAIMSKVSFYLFYLDFSVAKFKTNPQTNQSNQGINQKSPSNELKPSFFTFLFTAETRFNLKYPKKSHILDKFDLEQINKSISRLEEQVPANNRIQFINR